MSVPQVLSDTAVAVAKGISKIVLEKMLKSVQGGNRGVIIPYRSEGNENIICFVHGFGGDPGSTFTPLPEFIVAEKELEGWDIISIGYATDVMPNIGKGIWAATPDVAKVAGYLATNLDILFSQYKRVALIGHSMGGLVIQRALIDMDDISKVSHVLFFGTPSGGLRKAWFLRWFKKEISDLDYKGTFIKKLRDDWNARFADGYPFRFATVAGELDEFVPVTSSHDPFQEAYWLYTSGNHSTMVKPKQPSDTSFQIIKYALRNELKYLKGVDYKALNNLAGTYHEDVRRLAGKLGQLDHNGFRSYIFALEGTGKIDDAITAIEQSEAIHTNTDLMGILGGRWKRKYLLEDNRQYLELAINWYDKALSLSLEHENSAQVRYHAINLAFLYLMKDDTDLTPIGDMARLALAHCGKSGEGDYWEEATRAEAHLYLNQFETARQYYAEALKKSGRDIRATSSMMINAIYACNSLNRLDWRDELVQVFMS